MINGLKRVKDQQDLMADQRHLLKVAGVPKKKVDSTGAPRGKKDMEAAIHRLGVLLQETADNPIEQPTITSAQPILTFRNTEPTQAAIDMRSHQDAAVKDSVQRLRQADEEKGRDDERKATDKAAAQEQKRADKAAASAKQPAVKPHKERKEAVKEVEYESMSKKDLKDMCRDRKLAVSGSKDQLVKRLRGESILQAWIQCDSGSCRQWRRVTQGIDDKYAGEVFTCSNLRGIGCSDKCHGCEDKETWCGDCVQTEAFDTELDNASDEESDYEGSDTETQ